MFVKVRLKSGNPLSVGLLSPDSAGERNLPVGAEWRAPAFLVPELKTYAVVVIEGASVR